MTKKKPVKEPMAKKEETLFAEKVDKFLDTLNNDCQYINIQQVSKRGDPDRILCIKGKCIVAELKTNTGVVDKLQKKKLEGWSRSGAMVYELRPNNFSMFRRDLFRIVKAKY